MELTFIVDYNVLYKNKIILGQSRRIKGKPVANCQNL